MVCAFASKGREDSSRRDQKLLMLIQDLLKRSGAGETEDRRYLCILFAISLSLTYLHYLWIDLPNAGIRWEAHQSIIGHTAESPYRYRILVPWLAEAVGRYAHWLTDLDPQRGVSAGYSIILCLVLFAGLSLFQGYLRCWFERREALLGTLFVAAMLPLTFIHYYFQPTSSLEFVSFTLGMWLIVARRPGWFLALMAVSTLNRETSLLLVVIFMICHVGRMRARPLLGWLSLYGASWLMIYGSLRWAFGMAKHVNQDRADALTYRLMENLTTWDSYFAIGVFFGIGWWLAYQDGTKKPLLLRRALWFVPIFFAVYLICSNIHEVRYLLELCPIIVPLALMSLFGEGRTWVESPVVEHHRPKPAISEAEAVSSQAYLFFHR